MKTTIMIIGPDNEAKTLRHAILACHAAESIQVVFSPNARSIYEFHGTPLGLGVLSDSSKLINDMKIDFQQEPIQLDIYEKPVSKFINKSKRNYGRY
jgi:hypothetical protein